MVFLSANQKPLILCIFPNYFATHLVLVYEKIIVTFCYFCAGGVVRRLNMVPNTVAIKVI